MNQDQPKPSLPSPCRKICRLNEDDLCLGCARTRGEIGEWSQCSLARQAQIWANIRSRFPLGELGDLGEHAAASG